MATKGKTKGSSALRDFVAQQRASSPPKHQDFIIIDAPAPKATLPEFISTWLLEERDWVRLTGQDSQELTAPLEILTHTSKWWARLFQENNGKSCST